MKPQLRLLLSLVLTMTTATLFSLRSLAAEGATALTLVPEMAGTLTVRSGEARVNDNVVKTGATVLSGSRIVTSNNGVVEIDLGPLGRIEIRDNSNVTLTLIPGGINITSECNRTRIEVIRGQVQVRVPEQEVIGAGRDESYGDPVEATAMGSNDIIIDCTGKPVGLFLLPGLVGLLALIGVGVAVVVGDEDRPSPPRVSPIVP